MATKKAILLAHEAGFIPSNWETWSYLVRRAARAQTLAERRCNGSPYRNCVSSYISADQAKRYDAMAVKQEDGYERADERNDAVIRELAADLGLEVDLNGDPRGAVVKVRGQGIKGNSWGGEGWFCVS